MALWSMTLHPRLRNGFKFAGPLLWIYLTLATESSSLGATSPSWSTFGGNPKMDEPNLSRIDLSGEVPPHPENYIWTVVPRKNANSGTSALGHVVQSSSGFLQPRVVAFGTKIVPLHIKVYKNSTYYQFDNGSKELMWIDGIFLKIEAK